ncbi:hypothetical protein [Burkholderia stagnalis]|uniref:hypothetical protein n=1 Tax=Burkholderia stagnalis TaxID=1503054 RepID=UPI000B0F11F9|nr:hypothetical protein [Burkholderia stagnalis]
MDAVSATDFKPTPQSQSKRVSGHPIRTGFARREAEQAEAARAKNVSPAMRAKGGEDRNRDFSIGTCRQSFVFLSNAIDSIARAS